MALPKGMIRHPKSGILWARKDVPKELREIIGLTSLKATLRTKDLNEARSLFHGVMQDFEVRIANARKQLAGESIRYQDVVIDASRWGVSQESLQAYFRSRPENQIASLKQDIETKLEAAKLIANTPEQTSMEDLFKRWKRERQPRTNSENEYRRAKDLFVKTNGDKPIAEYTPADARAYKDKDAVLELNAPNGKPLGLSTR
jgi:hypothetical protein